MSNQTNSTANGLRSVSGQVVALNGLSGLAMLINQMLPEAYAAATFALTTTAVAAVLGAIALAAYARLKAERGAAENVRVWVGNRQRQ